MRSIRLMLVLALGATLLSAQSKPYTGKPQAIPGRIQAELYDKGGEGVAYHDVDAKNNGSGELNKGDRAVDKFRASEGVDISYTKPHDKTVDGKDVDQDELYLGWTVPGEWVKFTVNVAKSARYVIKGHYTSNNRNAAISVEFDDGAKSGVMALPSTTHWHKWRESPRLGVVALKKGKHVMTLNVLREGQFNIDYLEFVEDTADASATEVNARLARGTNIIGYDEIWNDAAKARFKDKHFELLRDGGFQHARINLQAFSHMYVKEGNELHPSFLKTLDWAVEKALAANLMVILDLHEFTTVAVDPERYHARIMDFWRQIAARYKNAPSDVVFEILNEPNGKLTPPLWNAYLKEALAIIRASNPTRTVIIGPAFWNNITFLPKLDAENDRHLIVTVHYYTPMEFTHQGAPWSKDTVMLHDINWGTDAEKARAVKELGVAAEWGKQHDRPIYLGEFGAYDKAPMESRVRYTSHIARTAESFGWSWGYWQFDSDFILYNIDEDHWTDAIWKALVP